MVENHAMFHERRGTAAGRAGDGRPVHLLAAMDHTSRAVLAQHQVGGAPEEVPPFGRCWPTSTFTAWWSPPTPSTPIPVPPSSW